MGALAGIFLPSLSDSDVSPTLGRDEGRVHIHRHHLVQDQSAAAAVFWPNLTLLQPRSTDDAVMGTLPHAAGEEFYPFQNDSAKEYFFIFGQSSNWISSSSGWTR